MCAGTKNVVRHESLRGPQLPPVGLPLSASSTKTLMDRAQQTFGNRLGYVQLRRNGKLKEYPHFFPLVTLAMWAVANAVADAFAFPLQENAVIIRTRHDVYMSRPFELGQLMLYFATGTRGKRLILTSEGPATKLTKSPSPAGASTATALHRGSAPKGTQTKSTGSGTECLSAVGPLSKAGVPWEGA